MLAVIARHSDIINILLEAHVNINAQTPIGDTALLFATYKKLQNIAETLVQQKADANLGRDAQLRPLLRRKFKWSVRMYFSTRDHSLVFISDKSHSGLSVVDLLVSVQCEFFIRTRQGQVSA